MTATVLVACIGNICRSPMAEGILSIGLPTRKILSAGTSALVGHPADATAIELMADRAIDISAHRAQQINQLLCQKADLILVMDQDQRKFIEHYFPLARGKVFRLLDGANGNIPDPYRKGEDAFRTALSMIDDGVRIWVERIKKI